MKILEYIPLSGHTTFKIGGVARYFCVVTTVDELKEALSFARSKKIPFFVLGGGSNVLVGDVGFSGLVIKMGIVGMNRDFALVTAWAGESWDGLVAKTVEWNLWGLENLSLIPGTVGAAPVQNIGAYGVEVKDVIESVRTIDTQTGAERVFSNTECCFGYRTSIFKNPEYKKYIIVSVMFKLRPGTAGNSLVNISYKDLMTYFAAKGSATPTQGEIRDAVIAIRTGKFPDLTHIGTAGSFWKNPIISREHLAMIQSKYPLIPSFTVDDSHVKVPLAWILDNVCGLKGFSMGRAALYTKQPLVLVVELGALASDVDRLVSHVALLVKEKTGIEIEREVEHL